MINADLLPKLFRETFHFENHTDTESDLSAFNLNIDYLGETNYED